MAGKFNVFYERDRADGSTMKKLVGTVEGGMHEISNLVRSDFATRFAKRRKPYTGLFCAANLDAPDANNDVAIYNFMTGGNCNHNEWYAVRAVDLISS